MECKGLKATRDEQSTLEATVISCTLEPEDKEEVGPPPNPGYSNSRVPVCHENGRTG